MYNFKPDPDNKRLANDIIGLVVIWIMSILASISFILQPR